MLHPSLRVVRRARCGPTAGASGEVRQQDRGVPYGARQSLEPDAPSQVNGTGGHMRLRGSDLPTQPRSALFWPRLHRAHHGSALSNTNSQGA